jgi:hypothetical protein
MVGLDSFFVMAGGRLVCLDVWAVCAGFTVRLILIFVLASL